ncbi:hypothetical protein [Geomicrobium sp. JCM 19055]|uniref:hypothetical protein n=1 Tax=Geomicrobium sp. JCM 19055 TaxID=1460649 RepID=UPI0005AA0F0A|nr:hypothetical protein [Geomicrobium sp. JCM 19055]
MIAAFMVAVAFGAMLVHQRVTDVEKWMLLIVLLFGGCGYLGLVLANSYFAFLSPSWLSGFWSTCTIIFITAAVVGYHPYYGFFWTERCTDLGEYARVIFLNRCTCERLVLANPHVYFTSYYICHWNVCRFLFTKSAFLTVVSFSLLTLCPSRISSFRDRGKVAIM